MKLKLVAKINKKSINDPMNPVLLNKTTGGEPQNPHIPQLNRVERMHETLQKKIDNILKNKFCVFDYKNVLMGCYETHDEAKQAVLDYQRKTGASASIVEVE